MSVTFRNPFRTLLKLAPALGVVLLLGLKAGDPAPDFSLQNQESKAVKLSDSKGHPVLIYFYPKDGTPGCTEEACTLRDMFEKYQKLGAVIYGVSTQNESSHKDFRAAHKLPFDLLVDPKGEMAKTYGVGFIKGTDLLERKSVLIGPDGHILKMYETVNPSEHAQEVLKDLSAIKS
jgi:peroxiredoxin Q/BCP